MALKDRQPGDYERLEAVRKFNKALEAHVTDQLSAHQATAIEQVRQDRRDYEMLSKALITDSTGQHKSVKAGARTGETHPLPLPQKEGSDKTDAFAAADLYDLY